MSYKRCFVSVDFDEQVKRKIDSIQSQIPEFIGKKTERENIHLTLKFLGEIDEETINSVKEKLKVIKLKSFEAKIDSIGVFSKEFVRIVWLGIKGCNALQKQVDEKLKGLFEKENRFQGHITIARVKSVNDKKNFIECLEKIRFHPIKVSVNEFKLKESVLTEKKPVYMDVGVFNLN